jgi:hypothetical protein
MNNKEKYLFLLEEIKEQQSKVNEKISILKALELVANKYASGAGTSLNRSEEEDNLPTEYNEDLTIPQKIYVSLLKINEGTAHDVSASLIKFQPTFGAEKAFKDCRNHLSRLYRKGKINARRGKKGRGFNY